MQAEAAVVQDDGVQESLGYCQEEAVKSFLSGKTRGCLWYCQYIGLVYAMYLVFGLELAADVAWSSTGWDWSATSHFTL